MIDFFNRIVQQLSAVDWTFTTTVVIAGIVIVMGVLILLIGIFYAFGAIVSNAESKSKARKLKKKEAADISELTKPAEKISEPVKMPPVVEDGISQEIVAVISAAIAATEGGSAVVRSIRKKPVSGRNPWANAAVIDNTRPF